MRKVEKACPIITRMSDGGLQILAFVHPTAGKQFVKGTIEFCESPERAAERELREESGLTTLSPLAHLGTCAIGAERQPWHFFTYRAAGLPDTWRHETQDDQGHNYTFFWHSLDTPPDHGWDPIFREAFDFFAPILS